MEQQGDEWLRFAYDANGRRARRTTSWGDDTRTAWSATGNLTRLDDTLGGEHRFFTDAFGRRHAWHGPGKVRSETQYDAAHRVIETHLLDALGQTLFQRAVTWDADDAVTAVREVNTRGGRRETTRYDRDAAGRVVGEAHDQEAPRGFRYDAADNLLTTPEGDAYEYDAAGRLQADAAGHAYRHDVNGRLVVVEGRRGKRTLWYDARDRLQRVHTEEHAIGGRTVRHEPPSSGLPNPQRTRQRDGMRDAGALAVRRDHPDLAERFERLDENGDALGLVTVVVRDQDEGALAAHGRSGA
jgi:YD repeat-containing protein